MVFTHPQPSPAYPFVFLIYGIFLYGMFGESNIGTMNWNSGQAAANILI
jgi:hypothetical protein